MTGRTKIVALIVASVAGAMLVLPASAAGDASRPSADKDPPPGDSLRIPGAPDIRMPPGARVFRHAPAAEPAAPPPGRSAAKSDPRKAQANTEPPPQKRLLDELFARLSRSKDSDEAEGIARSITRIWLRSGSDTADLLMSRVGTAVGAKKTALAEQLLDRIVALEPDWAEAWNRRATVRAEKYDDDGAMADIAQVLVREPRHFGALSGMGFIFIRHEMPKAALKVFRKVLALYPQREEIRKAVNKLQVEVEGRDI